MFAYKNNYYLYIENTQILDLNLIKKRNANNKKNTDIKPLSILFDAEIKPVEKIKRRLIKKESLFLYEKCDEIL